MVEIIKQNYHKNKVKFTKIKRELKKILGNDCLISHVGSTAIPRISGKNIIDILIGVNSLIELESASNTLVNNGYYLGNFNTKKYRFLASRKEETKSGDIHLHLAIINEKRYNDFLYLKDYLLDNPNISKKYSNYKKEILVKYGTDRKKYRNIKSVYVKKLIKAARAYHFNCLPKTLILIRHGENANDVSLDNDLLPLSQNGIKQAKKAREILKNSFDVIISSPSLRAKETANIIGNNMPYEIDERLLEKGYGNEKHNGKETTTEAIFRFTGFLHDLKKYKNKRVLVVTHGSLIRLSQNIIEEKNIRRKHIDNCEYVIYEKDSF